MLEVWEVTKKRKATLVVKGWPQWLWLLIKIWNRAKMTKMRLQGKLQATLEVVGPII